jgi:hypothetical protein
MAHYRLALCGVFAIAAIGASPAIGFAAVGSPVSGGLLVGLDGTSTLADGANKVKAWYDQIAAGGTQDFGQEAAALQPALLTDFVMPNGSLRSVVDFTANTGGTTGARIDSMLGTSSRILNFGDVYTAGADAAYGGQSAITWFVVFSADSLPTSSSRGIFSADFDDPAGVLDLQSNIQFSNSAARLRSLGRNATGSAIGATTGLNTFENGVGANWFVVAGQFNGTVSAVNGFAANTMTVSALRQDSVLETNTGAFDGIYGNHLLSSLGGLMSSTTSSLFDGKVAEFLYYNTALSAADTTSVMNYLKNKYLVNALHPGDFDGDGDVDGADFVAWQTNFPKESGAVLNQGDADGDGDVDGADFVVWQTNFPFTPSGGASPVPEPSGVILLAGTGLAFGLALLRRRAA